MADLSSQAFPVNTPKFWGNEKAAHLVIRMEAPAAVQGFRVLLFFQELVAKCIETGWISSEGRTDALPTCCDEICCLVPSKVRQ